MFRRCEFSCVSVFSLAYPAPRDERPGDMSMGSPPRKVFILVNSDGVVSLRGCGYGYSRVVSSSAILILETIDMCNGLRVEKDRNLLRIKVISDCKLLDMILNKQVPPPW